jgi:hypothetical protein
MKLATLWIIFFLLLLPAFLISSSKKNLQMAETLVCETNLIMAEMKAKSNLSRGDLYIVNNCTCQGIDPSIVKNVKITNKSQYMNEKGEIIKEDKEADCRYPRNRFYSCMCVGKSSY